ncbi:hypothetical protein MAPG_02676 [Magnaporthiopsis poae ATCC 64411]|uniref:Heterokaryon incompatibility domain-containing protein n=1 Tax=Magnaporthiopsis poae (strain ATCC 64411 / 73-15) TaxID=644358 RepID=A0A0C4DS07_MAGP6|nr:hypothetical protein MAPG_02676 [Magnaporthiopsis poae ATCC 64411]
MADGQGTAASTATEDKFCAPENKAFYDSAPYQPLDKEAREVRIVTLRPAQSNHEQLELRLKDKVPLASLDKGTIAVSYAAGDHAQTEVVRVSAGGKVLDFNAFGTLARALRAIRTLKYGAGATPDTECYVWADQICINQSDPTERAYQVNFMREIYRAVGTTIIYLGEDNQDGRGLAYVKTLYDYAHEEVKRVGGMNDEGQAKRVLDHVAEQVLDHVRNHDGAKDWWAASALFETPWWTRGWIFQEAIVSTNATVLHGSSTMPLSHFNVVIAAFPQALHSLMYEAADIIRGTAKATAGSVFGLVRGAFHMPRAESILTARREWHSRGCVPFDDVKSVLRHARACKTGDPRDRVYAFIGLADPAYNIQANYKIPAEEVFTNAAACIIKKEKSLEVVFDVMDDGEMSNLPSWVPDWTSPSRTQSPSRERFSASGGHPVQVEIAFPRASFESCGRVLRIQARWLDRLPEPERVVRVLNKGRSERDALADDLLAKISGGKTNDDMQLVSEAEMASFNERAQGSERMVEISGNFSCYRVAEGGYIACTESKAQPGDYLCVSLGASVPMLLRKEGEYFRFIGQAYVAELMRGEVMELWGRGLFPFQTVDLV